MADAPKTVSLVVLYSEYGQSIMDAFVFEDRETAEQVYQLLMERYGYSRVELMRGHYNRFPTQALL